MNFAVLDSIVVATDSIKASRMGHRIAFGKTDVADERPNPPGVANPRLIAQVH
jgi:hypothetical protein